MYSCSEDKLSRSKAKKLLLEHYSYKEDAFIERERANAAKEIKALFGNRDGIVFINQGNNEWIIKKPITTLSRNVIEQLVEKKFIEIKRKSLHSGNIYKFSDEFKKDIRYNHKKTPYWAVPKSLALNDIEIDGITIPENGGGFIQSIVKYNTIYKNSKFGDLVNDQYIELNNIDKESMYDTQKIRSWTQQAIFILYDDGWRIEKTE